MITQKIKSHTKWLLNSVVRKQKVAMFHPGRCGSTVLGNLMNQNDDLFWSGEPFERLMQQDRSLDLDTVRAVIRESENSKVSKVFSFATKYLKDMHLSKDCINMNIDTYVSLLSSLHYKRFIVIDRSNHLKRAISMEAGRASKQWHTTEKAEGPKSIELNPAKFEVGIEQYSTLVDYFAALDREYNQLLQVLQPYDVLKLNYESDIENDPLVGYRLVCDFLKVEYSEASVKLQKTNPFPVRDLLSNFDEVAHALNHTPYSWMLTE